MNTVQELRYELPSAIASFAGEINDTDGHEALPLSLWREEYGSQVMKLHDALRTSGIMPNPDVRKDDTPITSENVWKVKLEKAPGAFDIGRRLEVMDFTGVKRQILYPGVMGIYALALLNKADDPKVFASITGDRKRYAYELIDIHNDWVSRAMRNQDRARPTAVIVGETPEEMRDKMKALIDKGVRLFLLLCDSPPGGVSPAHPRMDPVWELAAAATCPVLGHISISENLLKTLVWRDAPAFEGWMLGQEFSLDPWTLSNIHLQAQNYVMTMVLGGVFDRHPKLIYGTAEFTGHWVGPLAGNMDRWYGSTPRVWSQGLDQKLKNKPSEYIRKNLRVACFDFEPVGDYIEKYGFEEVYCYASDFPHPEGGKDPMNRFVKSLEGQSPTIFRKFFVENGKALLPD
jgi:hypothetical protein